MRRPPPLTRVPEFPVSAGIGLIALAVNGLIAADRWSIDRFKMGPSMFHGEPWRVLTSTLPHVGFLHLAFNLYWLWVFGTLVEEVFGHVKTLALFVLLATGSMAAEYALFEGGVGLSGVGYGLFGLLYILAPRDKRFADAVDARTSQTFIVWFFFCIVATVTHIQPVANVAHGVGAILGALVGLAIAGRGPQRLIAAIGIPVITFASVVGAGPLRPKVNLAHDNTASFQLGYDAIKAGRYAEAIRNYRDAAAMNPKDAGAWNNLAIAYWNTSRWDEAIDAYRHAYEIDPRDFARRSTYVRSCSHVAMASLATGDSVKAASLYRTVVALDPADAEAWTGLARAEEALGHKREAEQARAKVNALSPALPTP